MKGFVLEVPPLQNADYNRFSYRLLAALFGILTPYKTNLTRSHKTKIPNRNESARNGVTMMKAATGERKRRKNISAVLRTRVVVVPPANGRRSASVLKGRTMTRTQSPITGRNEERASRPTNPVPTINRGRRGNAAPRQMTALARNLNPNQKDVSQVRPLNATGHHHRLAILCLRVSAEDLYTER